MCVVKHRSVLGCTFWQAGVLTLSPQHHRDFTRLAFPRVLPRACAHPYPSAWGCRPRLVSLSWESPVAQPPLLDPCLQLPHLVFESLPITCHFSHNYLTSLEVRILFTTDRTDNNSFYPWASFFIWLCGKTHWFELRERARGQWKVLKVWIAVYTKKKRGP